MSESVAVVQCCSGADVAENKVQLAGLVADAAQKGAKVILLPEMCLSMDAAQYRQIADSADHIGWFADLAREHNIWLLAGAVPQPCPDGDSRVRSALLVFNAQGEQVARYDKIHLFDVDVEDQQGSYRESERFAPGQDLVVVDTPAGKIGLSICFDLRFPEQFQALTARGAEVLVVPAAFTHRTGEAHWEVLLRARAIETQCYLLAANQCGWHDDKRRTWGHSMIIDPWGRILAGCEDEPAVALAMLDHSVTERLRAQMPLKRS